MNKSSPERAFNNEFLGNISVADDSRSSVRVTERRWESMLPAARKGGGISESDSEPRNLSIEAIQAVQSLKRAKEDLQQLDRVYDSEVKALIEVRYDGCSSRAHSYRNYSILHDQYRLLKNYRSNSEIWISAYGKFLQYSLLIFCITLLSIFETSVFDDVRKEHWYKPQDCHRRTGIIGRGYWFKNVKQDAQKIYGESLEFLEEEDPQLQPYLCIELLIGL
ncbi:hypothetical protein SDJN03_17630, partial [Cucurbita argyrosperma subsp. sororia]